MNVKVIRNNKASKLRAIPWRIVLLVLLVGVGTSAFYGYRVVSTRKNPTQVQIVSQKSNPTTICVSGGSGCPDQQTTSITPATNQTTRQTPITPTTTKTIESAPVSSSNTDSTYTPPAPVISVPSTTQICSSFYSTMEYQYNEAIDNLAETLASSEDHAANSAFEQNWTFESLINLINEDITNANNAISSDWISSFVTNLTASCQSPPSVTMLQVPACDAINTGGIAYCISQIDPSLGID